MTSCKRAKFFLQFYFFLHLQVFHQCLNTKGKNLYWPAKKELQITTACTLIYFISFFLRLLFLAMFVTSHLVLFACSRKKFLNSSNERERKVYFFPLYLYPRAFIQCLLLPVSLPLTVNNDKTADQLNNWQKKKRMIMTQA